MGGMWGFSSARERSLANQIAKLMLHPVISKDYNSQNRPNLKMLDQTFLTIHVYQLIYNKSMVHDSFLCKKFGNENNKPFPSKRIGNCFVGGFTEFCNPNDTYYDCPVECRPKEHIDWKTC